MTWWGEWFRMERNWKMSDPHTPDGLDSEWFHSQSFWISKLQFNVVITCEDRTLCFVTVQISPSRIPLRKVISQTNPQSKLSIHSFSQGKKLKKNIKGVNISHSPVLEDTNRHGPSAFRSECLQMLTHCYTLYKLSLTAALWAPVALAELQAG